MYERAKELLASAGATLDDVVEQGRDFFVPARWESGPGPRPAL
jgi:hypothetical protein